MERRQGHVAGLRAARVFNRPRDPERLGRPILPSDGCNPLFEIRLSVQPTGDETEVPQLSLG